MEDLIYWIVTLTSNTKKKEIEHAQLCASKRCRASSVVLGLLTGGELLYIMNVQGGQSPCGGLW